MRRKRKAGVAGEAKISPKKSSPAARKTRAFDLPEFRGRSFCAGRSFGDGRFSPLCCARLRLRLRLRREAPPSRSCVAVSCVVVFFFVVVVFFFVFFFFVVVFFVWGLMHVRD
jgi:hypothetical protein